MSVIEAFIDATEPIAMFLSILQQTPHWVWGLLAVLIVAGMKQTEARLRSVRSATLLPFVMTGLSFYGLASVFLHEPVALAAWVLGVAAALALCNALGVWRGVEWSTADRSLLVPGSWLPLSLFMTLFVLKFGVGVAVAQTPALTLDTHFAALVGLGYGGFSGAFAARGLAMWRVIRQAARRGELRGAPLNEARGGARGKA
ncbi:DUF6622 family protein [Paraburkholderia sp. DHOC27]|uniref:DUF6622 family protein n=1 Tax=Paraburkholderia sp. DHOC27 TaxID=2303330 RepID=UPI000E3E847F|nr:DUF6622 family protein [Paraburkholderia sp. DHOC27]RFU44568.1 hypothetical protein D0B32_26030 [Paraburkholderia sp. DHOC27]